MHTVVNTQEPIYERALQRERSARKSAEELLEKKSLELYKAHEGLRRQFQQLEKRNREIEHAHAELKRTQVQLVHSEKMASVGQLAAGVAHEINNPIAFVKSNLSTLGDYVCSLASLIEAYEGLLAALTSGSQERISTAYEKVQAVKKEEDFKFLLEDSDQLIRESVEGTQRVEDIVQGLKSFSRLDENTIKEVDINEGIESTLKVVWNELKYKCVVVKKFAELPMLRCYEGQLNQVFMNLLINAAQAILEKGVITVETIAEREHIVVKISDNGMGVPPEHLQSIFDPFFTTKDVGSGTGLGLAISYGIVQKHNGSIDVESEVGKGTTFTIRLPVNGISDE